LWRDRTESYEALILPRIRKQPPGIGFANPDADCDMLLLSFITRARVQSAAPPVVDVKAISADKSANVPGSALTAVLVTLQLTDRSLPMRVKLVRMRRRVALQMHPPARFRS
jgi:hypothetical protein